MWFSSVISSRTAVLDDHLKPVLLSHGHKNGNTTYQNVHTPYSLMWCVLLLIMCVSFILIRLLMQFLLWNKTLRPCTYHPLTAIRFWVWLRKLSLFSASWFLCRLLMDKMVRWENLRHLTAGKHSAWCRNHVAHVVFFTLGKVELKRSYSRERNLVWITSTLCLLSPIVLHLPPCIFLQVSRPTCPVFCVLLVTFHSPQPVEADVRPH